MSLSNILNHIKWVYYTNAYLKHTYKLYQILKRKRRQSLNKIWKILGKALLQLVTPSSNFLIIPFLKKTSKHSKKLKSFFLFVLKSMTPGRYQNPKHTIFCPSFHNVNLIQYSWTVLCNINRFECILEFTFGQWDSTPRWRGLSKSVGLQTYWKGDGNVKAVKRKRHSYEDKTRHSLGSTWNYEEGWQPQEQIQMALAVASKKKKQTARHSWEKDCILCEGPNSV